MCFGNAYGISRSILRRRKSRCNTSTNVSGDQCTSGRLSLCLSASVSLVHVSPQSPALHAGENSIFPIFPWKNNVDALLSRNMIAPLYIKQNEETARETERSFSLFHDKRKDCTAFYFSMPLLLFSFFSFLFPRTKFAISRHGNVLWCWAQASVKNNTQNGIENYIR